MPSFRKLVPFYLFRKYSPHIVVIFSKPDSLTIDTCPITRIIMFSINA